MNATGMTWRDWVWLPGVMAGLALIYLLGLDNDLVFDDALLTDGSLAEYGGLFPLRPRLLSYGSFVWVQDLVGEGWWKQRLVNLFLHLGVVLALWGLYREVLRHIRADGDEAGAGPAPVSLHQSPALGLALGFFALNPAAVYGVGYLVQRSILMATLFVVLALWLFARGLRTGQVWHHILAVVCYVLAVLSKEHAILAPLAALPVYILVSRPSPARLNGLAAAVGILVAGVGTLLWLRYGEIIGQPFDEFSRTYLAQLSTLGAGVQDQAYPLSILNQMWLFFRYGLLWLLPYGGWMSIDLRPPFPVSLASLPHLLGVLGYLAVLVGGFWLVIRRRDGLALVGFGLLLAALLFATEFATVWVQDPFVLYRSYLWALGVPALVFVLFHGLRGPYLVVAGVVLGGLLTWQAVDRVFSLSTGENAWTDAIARLSDDPRAVGRWRPHISRGHLYLAQGDAQRALADYQAASHLGDMGMGTFNSGVVLALEGRYQAALNALDEARRKGYDAPAWYYQRGVILHGLRQAEAAMGWFDEALKHDPGRELQADIWAHKGKTALLLGQRTEAEDYLARALALDGKHQEARLTLGVALVRRGANNEALALLDPLAYDWPDGKVFFTRALAHMGLKNKAATLADLNRAIRLDPNNPNLTRLRQQVQAMP